MASKRKGSKKSRSTIGIALEDAIKEIGTFIDDAIEFQSTDLEPDWATAERYYNGETDLEEYEGRSNVVKTEVRDAIRNSMPSIMRTLMHSRKIVVYMPTSVQHGMWIDQQSEYVTHLFYANGGYTELFSAILEAAKLKRGILKAFWEPDPLPTYFNYTKVPFDVVEALVADPLVEVEDFVRSEPLPTQLGDDHVPLYNVSGVRYAENGRIVIECTPNYEFFMSRNCSSIEQALRQGVHGQQQVVTVSEAMDMDLDYDGDWLELDAEDPELSDHSSSSRERKGYQKTEPNDLTSADVLRHKFLLKEAYIQYDLEDKGRPQTYRFFLGGTSNQYLHHEKVEDSPFSLIFPIPIPHNPVGHSLADLTINEQDTSSSLLRAIVDNAHAANDAKIAADPTKTNFDDIMNPALNAPIRKRSGDTLQVVQIPFTGQGSMQILQYLDLDTQNKVGITKAAQGLDPDAMQSTDKQAVLNTIQTSQGQTELMVRNIVETGLIRLFRILLRLSIQHQSPIQMMKTKGKFIPIDTRMFDPDATATPNVGLGTASPLQKQAALSMVLQKQEQYMQTHGPNNPFTSFAQMYNTLEDLLEANGIYNVERYFSIVTPEVEQQWAKMQQERQAQIAEQAAKDKPIDPSKAFLEVEQGKRKNENLKIVADARDKERQRSIDALDRAEKNDIQRDKNASEQKIHFLELAAKYAIETESDEAEVDREQKANDTEKKRVSSAANSSSSSPNTERRPEASGFKSSRGAQGGNS